MQARIPNLALVVSEAIPSVQALWAFVEKSSVPARTLGLVHLRVSQINGCSVCLDLDSRMAKKRGETDQRLFTVAGWRDAPYFSDEERAALALAEAVTRLSDRSDPVPDHIWNEAARHYDQPALAALVLGIATVNVWNRLNVATRQVAGEWASSPEARKWTENNMTPSR